MKCRNIALTLMVSFCFSGTIVGIDASEARADNPFEKLIPRGKLLKMLKNEITGEGDKVMNPDSRRAARPRPTAAPTPSNRGEHTDQKHQQHARHRVTSRAQPPTMTRPLPPMTTGARKRPVAGAAVKRGRGFGMMVQASRDDNLIVTAVSPGGNAARSGMRSGDQLLSVGGGEITAVEEFKQIAKSLGQGDQIEVEFARKGRKLKTLLQFGTAPEETEIAASGSDTTSVSGLLEAADFDDSLHSVLDAPVEHISRLAPMVSRPQTVSTGRITSLNQTIESQRQQMQAMSEELKLLRKSHQPAIEPTENNWSFPDLTGPGGN